MTARNLLLTAHILVAIVTLGWLSMTWMAVPRLMRGGPASLPALRWAHALGERLGRLSLLVFVLGIVLVLRDGDDGLTFAEGWISASMGLFILAVLNAVFLIGRTERAAIAKLEHDQPATAEAGRVSMLGGVNMLLLTVITYLMVAKP